MHICRHYHGPNGTISTGHHARVTGRSGAIYYQAFLRQPITEGFFTLDFLNCSIRQFNYPEYVPSSERPNEVKDKAVHTNDGTFRQSGE